MPALRAILEADDREDGEDVGRLGMRTPKEVTVGTRPPLGWADYD